VEEHREEVKRLSNYIQGSYWIAKNGEGRTEERLVLSTPLHRHHRNE
jgi:hypothetical protein